MNGKDGVRHASERGLPSRRRNHQTLMVPFDTTTFHSTALATMQLCILPFWTASADFAVASACCHIPSIKLSQNSAKE
jgi:hypothetical protein